MKIFRVDMGSKRVWSEEEPPSLIRWGRGLIPTLLKEIDATCEPLGPGNRLIFATGPFAATNLSSVHRLSVGGKSPLTGGIKEANSGGTLARHLARAGYKAIVVDGQAADQGAYILKVGTEDASLLPAPELSRLGTYALAEKLQERFGPEVSVCCVGPAGEMGMLAAGVAVTDADGKPGRYAGRGGLGAVMGRKGLKASWWRKARPVLRRPLIRRNT